MPFGIGRIILGGSGFRWNDRSRKNDYRFENDSILEMTTTFLSFDFHFKNYVPCARTDRHVEFGVSGPRVWVPLVSF